MASQLLSKRVLYLPNFRAAVNHFRAFSWVNTRDDSESFKVVGKAGTESLTVWPDEKLGPIGPQDKRFPLPGRVGIALTPRTDIKSTEAAMEDSEPGPQMIDLDALFEELPCERQKNVLLQVQDQADFLEDTSYSEESQTDSPSEDDFLECVAHECSKLRKDFADLFPWRDIMHGSFTIITISQKTQEDMSSWSEKVEAEREELLETFIEGATEICEALQKAGYWADFIDPSCGKPYFGEHTNATLFETDERYCKLGFEIEDLGCCKVIGHRIWGTKAYVGCIFTNAPTTYPLLTMMKKP